jgi:outer membrane protein assembly factor BamB
VSETSDHTLRDVVTVAADTSTGKRLWAARWEPPADNRNVFIMSVQGGRDAVFVTGNVHNNKVPGRGFTIAYDALTGDILWQVSIPGFANDSALSDDLTRLFVVGSAPSTGLADLEGLTVAYATFDGQLVWSARLRPGDAPLSPGRIASHGNRVTVAASERVPSGPMEGATSAVVVATYLATGAHEGELLSTAVERNLGGLPTGLALTRDGRRAFVTHAATEPQVGRDDPIGNLTHPTDPERPDAVILTMYDSDTYTFAVDTTSGGVVWHRRLKSLLPQVRAYTYPTTTSPIQTAPDDRTLYLAVYAHAVDVEAGGYTTLAYDAQTGEQLWAQTMGAVSGECWSCGPALSVNPASGSIVVAAQLPLVVMANRFSVPGAWSYSPSGDLEWTRASREGTGGWNGLIHTPSGRQVILGGRASSLEKGTVQNPNLIMAGFETGTGSDS